MSEALPPIAEGSVAPHFAALCAKIQAEARHTAAQPGPAAALNAAILALLACLVGCFAVLFARLEAGDLQAEATPPRRTPRTPARKAFSPWARGLDEGSPRAVPMPHVEPQTHSNPAATPRRRSAAIHTPAPSRGRQVPFPAIRRCRPGAAAKNAAPAQRRLMP